MSQALKVPLSRLEALVLRFVSRFCVDPASGDIVADGVFRWPDRPEVLPPLPESSER